MTSPSLSHAMSAERIEKAAEAAYERILANAGVTDGKWKDARPSVQELWRMVVRDALRAAYLELADGSSVILPREASDRMVMALPVNDVLVGLFGERGSRAVISEQVRQDYAAMRDAALSAPEFT